MRRGKNNTLNFIPILAGPCFGFARNDFKFVFIGIRGVTTRNNNYLLLLFYQFAISQAA